MTQPTQPDQNQLITTSKRKRVTRASAAESVHTKRSKPNDRPRWHTQSYLLFLALRQHPERSLPRGQLIRDALALDRKFSKELGLPKLYTGLTPDNSASSILTKNPDRYFVPFIPEGTRFTHFRLAYEPGNVDTAVQEYEKWWKKLIEHDWPYCFGVPKANHYHTPVSEVDSQEEEDEEAKVVELLEEAKMNQRSIDSINTSKTDTDGTIDKTIIDQHQEELETIKSARVVIKKQVPMEKEPRIDRFKRITRGMSQTLTISSTLLPNQQVPIVESAMKSVKLEETKDRSRRVTRGMSGSITITSTLLPLEQAPAIENTIKSVKLEGKQSNKEESRRVTRGMSRTATISNTLSPTQQVPTVKHAIKPVEKRAKKSAQKLVEKEPKTDTFRRMTRAMSQTVTPSTVQRTSAVDSTVKPAEKDPIIDRCRRVTRGMLQTLPTSLSTAQQVPIVENTLKPKEKEPNTDRIRRMTRGTSETVTRSLQTKQQLSALENTSTPTEQPTDKAPKTDEFKKVTRGMSQSVPVPSATQQAPASHQNSPKSMNSLEKAAVVDSLLGCEALPSIKDKTSNSLLLTQPNKQENDINKRIPEPLYALDQLDLSNIPRSWRDIVTIAPSKIPNAGNGLFATRTLPYNTPIGFYFGVPMTEDEFDSLKDRVGRSSEYSIMYRHTVLDATDDQGEPITDPTSPRFCPFHFMNETSEQAEASVAFVEGYVVNQVICWTRKEIQPGQELLAWYGADVNRYWQQKRRE